MERALEAALHHWRYLAERYKTVPTRQLSFDLLNEPPFMVDQSRYVEIAGALIAAIRETSPERLIFADGADIGQTPVRGLVDQAVVHSTRGYLPKMVSHYTAAWVPADEFEVASHPNLADDRQSRRSMGSQKASGSTYLEVATAKGLRRANTRRRVGLFQQNSARYLSCLDERSARPVERSWLGLVDVESPRTLRRPRQWSVRCQLRNISREPARPQDA